MNKFRSQQVGFFGVIVIATALGLHADSSGFVPSPIPLTVSADTIETSVQAGSVLITALPAPVDTTGATFEVIRAPALSWLVDRSFFWNTRAEDTGTHHVLFRRISPARTDTLVLAVTLTP